MSSVPSAFGPSEACAATTSATFAAASDICAVGGGTLGIATARELPLRHPDARVVVTEREPVAGFVHFVA